MGGKSTIIWSFLWFLIGIVSAGIASFNIAEGNSILAGILGTAGACGLTISVVEEVLGKLTYKIDELKKELESLKKKLSNTDEK